MKNGDLDLMAGIAYSEDRSDLLSELNMAISVVNEQDAMELDELKNKYYTETSFTFVRTLIKCIISSFYMCFVIDYPHNPLRP